MTNLGTVLRSEITRLARRSTRPLYAPLKERMSRVSAKR